ncbi:TPA: hypothetical protein N0F65_011783, partial [Lagenidium giganteum]
SVQTTKMSSCEASQSSFQDQCMSLDVSLVHENFTHLSTVKLDALKRLAQVMGSSYVTSLLRERGSDAHRAAAVGFLDRERPKHTKQASPTTAHPAAASWTSPRTVGPTVNHSCGAEVELGQRVRRVTDDFSQVAFARSKLTGRARSWFGHHMADVGCFSSLAVLTSELRAAFEPSKSEFLLINSDLHEYVHKLRYIVAGIVDEPIDMATFMKCLRDGPTKAQLFRVFSSTLEGAIALAQQEDFSSPQARAHASRASARHEPEPKDICMVHARARSNSDAPVEHRVHFA